MDPLGALLEVCGLAERVCARRERLQREVARGYEAALGQLAGLRDGTAVEPRIPGGMVDALCIAAELGRPVEALDRHYLEVMPGLLAQQLRGGGPEERLFSTRLSLRRMPRLRAALEALFGLVAEAGVGCARALGAATPEALLAARPTLGELYAGCHFGRSMPMLYAYPGDLAALPAGRDLEAFVDQRYPGPIAHELAHLIVLDERLVPAPGNLHEALAAWLGSEAWPEQLVPLPGGLDALPGGPFYAAVGAWVARATGPREAIRAQAGALDLRDALGAPACEALRLYGWLPHLETSAPHLLADTFQSARWWKLVDLQRDPALAARFAAELIDPLLSAPPPRPGCSLVAHWNAALDALAWPELPAWRDPAGPEDGKLARRAVQALSVRTARSGRSFRAERIGLPPWRGDERAEAGAAVLGEGRLRLDVRACLLRSAFPGTDAVGAPPWHPYPPALCAAYARAGFAEVRGDPEAGLPPPPPEVPAARPGPLPPAPPAA